MFGHRTFQPVIKAIIELAEKAPKSARSPRSSTRACSKRNPRPDRAGPAVGLRIPVKQDPLCGGRQAKEKVMAHYFPEGQEAEIRQLRIAAVFKELEAKIVRWNILDTGKRIDGRDSKTFRSVIAEVGVLPRAHGSALSTRGETQAMVVTTLARRGRAVYRRAVGTYKETFLHALQLPSLTRSVKPDVFGAPKRREIGHASSPGARSIRSCRRTTKSPTRCAWFPRSPNPTDRRLWPRSAAPSLALMDAGVPLKRRPRHRDGSDPGRVALAVLSDILGDEDHLGDMDFRSPAPTRASPRCR